MTASRHGGDVVVVIRWGVLAGQVCTIPNEGVTVPVVVVVILRIASAPAPAAVASSWFHDTTAHTYATIPGL